jgi:hypothetical protein
LFLHPPHHQVPADFESAIWDVESGHHMLRLTVDTDDVVDEGTRGESNNVWIQYLAIA